MNRRPPPQWPAVRNGWNAPLTEYDTATKNDAYEEFSDIGNVSGIILSKNPGHEMMCACIELQHKATQKKLQAVSSTSFKNYRKNAERKHKHVNLSYFWVGGLSDFKIFSALSFIVFLNFHIKHFQILVI